MKGNGMPRKYKPPTGVEPRTDLWTPQEDQILIDAGGKLTIAQLNELLPARRADAVYKRCRRLGVEWFTKTPVHVRREGTWTPAEIKVLRDARGTLTVYELYLLLPKRNKPSIRNKLEMLGLTFRKTQRRPTDQPSPRPVAYKPPTDTRRCLTCGVTFQSWGPGNRLCPNHRHGDGTVW
jgi:hypothetical protein